MSVLSFVFLADHTLKYFNESSQLLLRLSLKYLFLLKKENVLCGEDQSFLLLQDT